MDKYEIIGGILRLVSMVALFGFFVFFAYVIMTDVDTMLGG